MMRPLRSCANSSTSSIQSAFDVTAQSRGVLARRVIASTIPRNAVVPSAMAIASSTYNRSGCAFHPSTCLGQSNPMAWPISVASTP
jgi:ABC-type dipeptide/oligopeptide/nickel transport system permease component